MAKSINKRKICFPIMSRVHYARQKYLLSLLNKHPNIDLQLVVGGSVLLDKYGERFIPAMKKEGLNINETITNVIDGGNHVAMAKTAGLTALEFANSLHKLDPDIVLIRGDRFEQLAMAMTAAYMNKTIAHIEGGDVTGTIDESVRHAITKLAHVHFVTNEDAKKRVIKMGEDPNMVFNVGSPDIEFVSMLDSKVGNGIDSNIGVGYNLDFKKPYLVIMQHPVTTEKNNGKNMEILLKAIDDLNMQAVWFWPNSDAGTKDMAKAIRSYRENGKLKNNKIRFVTDILPENFIKLVEQSAAFVGNSSAGIKECSYLGTPFVNIGTRQDGRLRAENVFDVDYNGPAIKRVIKRQVSHGKYKASDLYYKKDTSKKILDILNSVRLHSQKKFHEA